MRRDTGTDDPRVRMRANESSRPRTKVRPDRSKAPIEQVIAINRGRYRVRLKGQGVEVQAVRAKELKRGSVITGNRVRVTGDLSGRVDTLARIVVIGKRSTALRRSLEDAPDLKGEKAVITNAEFMCIVVALADPLPRTGMIGRCLVTAYEARMRPIPCLTKTDLVRPDELLEAYRLFNVTTTVTSADNLDSVDELRRELEGHLSVLIGHSGAGKSTLINALVPSANRAVSHVNEVTGRGRRISTSSEAFELAGGGWIVDTPGVRSFGVGHVSVEDILSVFPEVDGATRYCLPLCSYSREESSCAIDAWAKGHSSFEPVEEEVPAKRKSMAESVRRLLVLAAIAEAVSKAVRWALGAGFSCPKVWVAHLSGLVVSWGRGVFAS